MIKTFRPSRREYCKQMMFDPKHVDERKWVLVHDAVGNVGAYAVQLAKRAGTEVIATALIHVIDFVM
jgi:NADPH:quinone reductase-like Zn-dependent oxidoreductase